MNAYQQAQTLGITGTDAEIAATVSTLTRRDIPIDALASYLREKNLLAHGLAGPYGLLVTVYGSTDDAELKAGLDEIHASVLSRQAPAVRTATMPDVAVRIASALEKLSAIPNASTIAEGMYALGGGLAYSGTTAEQIAAQRAAEVAAQAKEVALGKVTLAAELAQAEAARAESTPESIIAVAVAELSE